jgi:hypothetical protein
MGADCGDREVVERGPWVWSTPSGHTPRKRLCGYAAWPISPTLAQLSSPGT